MPMPFTVLTTPAGHSDSLPMTKILFVCHGNICRSPMAEFIMKHIAPEVECASAATSFEEIGNEMYSSAKQILRENGIPYTRHLARRICSSDYDDYDMIIGMDESNMHSILRFFGGDPEHKISMLLDRPVADPWYYGNFEKTYDDLLEGCQKLKAELAGRQ